MKTLISILLLLPIYAFAQTPPRDIYDIINNYNFSYYTIENGLPDNFIDDIYKDSKGFLWLATPNGLSRYDGYEFTHYNISSEAVQLKSNFVRNICEDDFYRLWIVSEGGIDVLDLKTNKIIEFIEIREFANQESSHIIKDKNGNIWIVSCEDIYRISFTDMGYIAKVCSLNPEQKKLDYLITAIAEINDEIWVGSNHHLYKVTNKEEFLYSTSAVPYKIFESNNNVHCFLQDKDNLWIGTDRGLYCYSLQNENHRRYRHNRSDPKSLSQSFITSLAKGPTGEIIIATLRGINFYNTTDDSFIRLFQKKGAMNGLNCNFINSLLTDHSTIWIGTEIGGLNKMTKQDLVLQSYINDKDDPESLSENPVNSIFEDTHGNLWVGNIEGGLNLKPKGSNGFIHFRHSANAPHTISHNSVSAIVQDNQNNLWVGTWGMGVNVTSLNNIHNPVFTRYTVEQSIGLNNDFISSMCFDPINNGMWIGTLDGLHFFDLTRNKLDQVPLSINKFYNNTIIGLCIDPKSRLWAATSKGLLMIDLFSFAKSRTGFTYSFKGKKLDDPESSYVEKLNCVYVDSKGDVWLGSHYGLYRLVSDENSKFVFESFTVKNGLSNNNVLGILEDEYHNIWVSTNYGISCFNPEHKTFRNFFVADGILENQFYWNAFHKSASTGTLYFGNLAGLIGIQGIRNTFTSKSRVALTKLTVLNEVIHGGDNKYIKENIINAKELKLHERDKSFSIEFSALNYNNADVDKYAYRLKGFDNNWTETEGTQHVASYTNLNSGKYVFQVRSIDNNSYGQSDVTELLITISPFFYKTWWFYSLILAIIIISAVVFYLWRISTLKKQKDILALKVKSRTQALEEKTVELSNQNLILKKQYEKINRQKTALVKMSKKVQEITADKIAFFTNITHEFRTPITLIVGPIERAINLSYNPEVLEQLHIVERNSKSLLSLVNQLLDFRKIESNNIEIKKRPTNLIAQIEEIIIPFDVFAHERNIIIRKYYRVDNPYFMYDEEWIRKVIVNLLSNAIKFTPNDGHINVYICSFSQINTNREKLYICVNDNGIGIPANELENIFNRFYQSKKPIKFPVYGQSGTGIGLYLCQRIIKQHGGNIYAKNNKKHGTSFRVLLNLKKCKENIAEKTIIADKAIALHEKKEDTSNDNKLTILIVEDNRDMRSYIRSILSKTYNTLEAENGMEAIVLLTQNNKIDFIISDIMMPIMDGIEFSKQVKENIATSHIPILLLTAKTSDETRMESFKIGVDEYLVKPFEEKLLLIRIENILSARRQHQNQFKYDMNPKLLNIDEQSKDQKFMDKVMNIIAENYKNPDFEVTLFASKSGMSKTLLNKKLQELTGQSIAKFIRGYRLNVAQKLIILNKTTRNMNVSEIAYEVGFNDPKYFARVFNNHFGMLPSTLINS